MDKFLQVIVVLGLMSYGVKGVIKSQVENIKEGNNDKIEAAKSLAKSVSAPIEVGGQKIDMTTGNVDINHLYGLAQQEADKMIQTGDVSAFQKQLEGDQGLLNIFGGINKAATATNEAAQQQQQGQ